MFNLKKKGDALFELPREPGMHVPGLIVATEELLEEIAMDRPLEQVRNVAFLPGIVGYSIAMPDIHWGYGFPIGGVAAMDPQVGVISPGGVGYDINCGVRLAVVPESYSSLSKRNKSQLLNTIFRQIPSGIGQGRKNVGGLSDRDYAKLVELGAAWSVAQGFGYPKDLEHTESNGVIQGGDICTVSRVAKRRGEKQLGSIGSGNHFVEIGEVEHVFLKETAEAWGIEKGQIYILIHSGSRGFGHQVCQDTLNCFIREGYAENLPDKQLVAAPILSDHGKQYFSSMAAAANFAFNNRQQILHLIRHCFYEVLGVEREEIRQIYDVCHNIAKFEEHEVAGEKKMLCVHRKGATRAFGKGDPELSSLFQKTGQPVLVPGDMGRASHLMVGLGNPITWSSSCHGAGRARSRIQSRKNWQGKDPIAYMERQDVQVMATSNRTILEEMPDAYKDVDLVVEAVQRAHLAKKVVRLRPHLVMKG